MAITVYNEPQLYTPSDNPVTWTFDSDQTAQDNFYFEVTVFINDVAVFDDQIYPESGINAKFDASSWASNACSVPTESQNLQDDAANYAQVKIRITERYGDPVADQATVTTTNINVWKAKMTDEDFEAWVYSDYAMVSPIIGKKYLTNYPDSEFQKVGLDEQVRLMAITNEVDITFHVTLYDENDISIATDSFTYGAANKISIFNFSPNVIIADTTITTGDFSTCVYFVITTTLIRFNDYRFNINTDCQYRTYRRLHCLSQWGSMEAYSFNLISRRSYKFSSNGYTQRWGRWDGTDFLYEAKQGRNRDFAKTVESKLTVESDWLTEAIQHWIVQNYYSIPAVFIELDNGDLARRKVVNSAAMDNIQENDATFRELVQLELPTYISYNI